MTQCFDRGISLRRRREGSRSEVVLDLDPPGIDWSDRSEPVASCSGRLLRRHANGVEVVARAQGATYNYELDDYREMFLDFDSISREYGDLAWAIQQADALDGWGLSNPLLVVDLVVAPQWRGHNIGPHLLRWMALALGLDSIFLVPVPLPTRRLDSGEWVSDWELPRPGSGAMRKVRRAYRGGGFTHLRHGTWWTGLERDATELARIRRVLAPLEA